MQDISCKILFERNPKQFYYAGEICRGTVDLSFYKEKNVREVYVKFEGIGYARFDFGSGTQAFKENYLSKLIYFFGTNNTSNQFLFSNINYVSIQHGTYILPFSCRLPSNLPSTIEAEYGYIRYKVTLVIDRLHLWSNKSFSKEFTVFRRMNLNDSRIDQQPIVKYIREDVGFWRFFHSSNNALMMIAIRLAPSAYIPGEEININIETTNNSSSSITNFRIRLIKVVHFQKNSTSFKYITEKSTIVEKLVVGCNGHAHRKTEVKIPLKLMQPTDMTCSTICKVYYILKINAIVDALFCNPSVELPIIIGTIPFSTLDVSQMNSDGVNIGSVVDSQPTNLQPSAPSDDDSNSTTAVASSSNHFNDDTATTSSSAYGFSNKILTKQYSDPPTYEEATITSNSSSIH